MAKDTAKETPKALPKAQPKPQKKEHAQQKLQLTEVPKGPVAPLPKGYKVRLADAYRTQVQPALMKDFSLSSPMACPKLSKIVINIGVSEAKENIQALDLAKDDLMRHSAAGVTTEAFPHHLKVGGIDYALSYHFEPGSPRDGVTLSSIDALGDEQRVGEIARMLGGVKITPTTRQHAAELLGQAIGSMMLVVDIRHVTIYAELGDLGPTFLPPVRAAILKT